MRLSAIFGDMGGFKRDLFAYAVMGVGVVGGIAAYNFAFNKVIEMAKITNPSIVKYGRPVGAVVLGIVGGSLLARKVNANIGQGFAVGLTAAGLLNLANAVAPEVMAKLPVSGGMTLAGMRGMRGMRGLRGAPIQIEQVRGAPTSVQVAGFGRLAPTLY